MAIAVGALVFGLVNAHSALPSPEEPTAEVPASPIAAPLSAQQLIDQSLLALDTHRSVAARIRQRVDLFGQTLTWAGAYLGSPPTNAWRLELKARFQDQVGTVQEICDGRDLWIHCHLPHHRNLAHVDMQKISQLDESSQGPQPAASVSSAKGGISRLLYQLSRSFEFHSVRQTEFQGVQVFELRGRWSGQSLARLLPKEQAAIEAGRPVWLANAAPLLPDEVRLLIDRADLFPYRVEYLRRPRRFWFAAEPQPVSLMVLDFFEVQFDVPADPSLFIYQPGDTPVSERTTPYATSLGLAP